MSTTPNEMKELAQLCVKTALAKGAKETSVRAYRVRDVTVEWRDGKLEKIQEATTRGVNLGLYVDGRYSSVSSSDLRKEALDTFIGDAISMTRTLAADPHRALPDPTLYQGQATVDLKLVDPAYGGVTPEQRRKAARELEEAARAVPGAKAFLSVSTGFNDTRNESVRVHSNGFEGSQEDTSFWTYASVSIQDPDGRRPEEWSQDGTRFVGELPAAGRAGKEAAQRALSRLGARKAESGIYTMVLDNRAGGRLVSALGAALTAASVQQKRSFLEGRIGQPVGSALLSVDDDPLLVRGFGSRLYDGEGLAARKLPIFEQGVLRNFYVDNYYGRKLGMKPTTAGTSNLSWVLGGKGQAQVLADVKEGILVTGFIGGNSNPTTGDFSFGVQGFRIRGGQVAEPVAEMNISGNHAEVWKRLTAVGNDPYAYSSLRTPTLVFEGIQFAGV